MSDSILVTGGAGFIGSNFVLEWLRHETGRIVNLDKLTYAGDLRNLASLEDDPRHVFIRGDINDIELTRWLLKKHLPRAIVHFAAETHVDRSIADPWEFMRTNVEGTFHLLQEALLHWTQLPDGERESFRFLHISTDEVYGSLGVADPAFTETSPYRPSSPYAASKAAADHLVRAYHTTYRLPAIITNCSNNYGPLQFTEKLIPLVVVNAIAGKPLPLYGDGSNVRDWLYVLDHCAALRAVLARGRVGETYNIGGGCERNNVEVVSTVCELLNELLPNPTIGDYRSLITFVTDRPGHDRRYAIDSSKIRRELGWAPRETSSWDYTKRFYGTWPIMTGSIISGQVHNVGAPP